MNTSATAVCEEYLSLRPGVLLASNERALMLFRREIAGEREVFRPSNAMKRAVLRRLAEGPCAMADLLTVAAADGCHAHEVSSFVDALRRGGWLVITVYRDGRELYAMEPLHARPDPPPGPAGDLVLSRFAVLRREGDRYVVESPLAGARMLVRDAQVWALIGELARPMPDGTPGDPYAADPPPGGPFPVELCLRRDMRRAGLIVTTSAEATADLDQWRPHDLWLHARSRIGSRGYVGSGFGRTRWAEPAPIRREPFPGPAVELYRPDLDALRESDPPLTTVIEGRRTTRRHDDRSPITADQLAELLYRCARARHSHTSDGVEYLSRPHPSGGSAYELELYPVVHHASGIEPGMYHYDPYGHRLRLVRESGPAVTRLLETARLSAQMSTPPQVLIVVAARFGRLMRTYEELAYSLILKHVGVLYQTMYLVATAMGLAACGLGGGDAMAFNEATGLDYPTEGSVGEFLLGGRVAR